MRNWLYLVFACLIGGCSYGSIRVVDLRDDAATPEDSGAAGTEKDTGVDGGVDEAGVDAQLDAETADADIDAGGTRDAGVGDAGDVDAGMDAAMDAAMDGDVQDASDAAPMGGVVEPAKVDAPHFTDGAHAALTTEPCDDTKAWTDCAHVGRHRKLVVPGRDDCAGLSAVDAHGWYDWTCSVEAGEATFYTSDLREHVRLSDLLDIPNAVWRSNVVTVLDGVDEIFVTEPAPFWSDPIVVVAPSTASVVEELDEPHTVYLIRASGQYPGLLITSDHVSLLIADGVEVHGGPTNKPWLEAISREHLWIEAGEDAVVDARGHSGSAVHLDVRFSEIRGLLTENASTAVNASFDIKINAVSSRVADLTSIAATGVGILLEGQHSLVENLKAEEAAGTCLAVALSMSQVTGVRAIACGDRGVQVSDASGLFASAWFVATTVDDGIHLAHVTDSALDDVTVANAGARGIALTESGSTQASANVTLSRVSVYGSVSGGILLEGPDHRLIRATTASNDEDGVRVAGRSALLMHLTSVMNTGVGVHVTTGALDTSVANVVSAANSVGLRMSGSAARTHVRDLFATDNGLDVDVAADDNTFAGVIDVTTTDSCEVSAALAAPGLSDPCASQGGSTAIFVASRTTVGAFVGKVTGTDSVNTDDRDGLGTLAYDDIQDWTWSTSLRNWGRDGTYGTQTARGRCSTGQVCVPWDHRVLAAGALADPMPGTEIELSKAEHVLVHTWSPTMKTECDRIPQAGWDDGGSVCASTVLDHSFLEVLDTAQDGLCGNGEMCVMARNRGAYVGRGDVVTLFTVVNVPTFGWFKSRWFGDNGP